MEYKTDRLEYAPLPIQDALLDFGADAPELPTHHEDPPDSPPILPSNTRTDKRLSPSLSAPPMSYPGPNYRRCHIIRLNKAKAVTKNTRNLDPIVFQVYPSKGPTYVGLDLGRDVVSLKGAVFFYGTVGIDEIKAGTVPPAGVECYAFTREEVDLYCPIVNIRDFKLIPTQVSNSTNPNEPVAPPAFAVALHYVGMLYGKQCWFSVLVSWLDSLGVEHTALSDAFLAVSHCIKQRKRQLPPDSSSALAVSMSVSEGPTKKRQQHPKQKSPCPYCIEEGITSPWQHIPKATTLLQDEKQRDKALQKAWMTHYIRVHKSSAPGLDTSATTAPATAAPLSLIALSQSGVADSPETSGEDREEPEGEMPSLL